MSTITTGFEDGVFTITLSRPEKRNAMTFEMIEGLEAAVEEAKAADKCRVVVLRGEGQSFSAGIDFTTAMEIQQRFPTLPSFRAVVTRLQAIMNQLEALELPVIALIHGHCYGLGLELAMAADFRIAAEGTLMALQEAELGIIPDVGGTTRLTRLVGIPLAKELIMTGRKMDATEALSVHLVNEVVAEDALDDALAGWLERLSRCAPLAVGLVKKIIDRGAHLDKLTLMELEGLAQSTLIRTKDMGEAVMAKFQKRAPEFTGE